jgi:hypothetical protein
MPQHAQADEYALALVQADA